jgi:hypothetical protein
MTQKLLAAILLLMASHIPSDAQIQIFTSSVNTADIVTSCRRVSNPLLVECAGYILGVYDQLAISGLICPPSSGGGTSQAVAVALKFLNDHPDRWHLHPAFLLAERFKEAFPCGQNSN